MAEPLNATFFAFRKRGPGGALLSTSLLFAALWVVLLALFAWLNWRPVLDYLQWLGTMNQSMEQADPNDPFAIFAAMTPPASVAGLFPSYVLFLLLNYLLLASYEAACLKWMIHGERGGLLGLALNADTLRIYFTYWLWYFLLMAAYMAGAIIGFGVVLGVALASQGDSDSMGPAAAVAILLVMLGVIVAMIYFAVRFAPAAAASIARRRFSFFDAWTVTKGRFWALFGSFALLFVIYFVAVMALGGAAMFAIAGGLVSQMQQAGEPRSLEDALAIFSSPAAWAPLVICYGVIIAVAFVFYIALFGVNARAVQAALAEGKIQVAD